MHDFIVIGAQEPAESRLLDNSNVFKGIPPYITPYGRDLMAVSRKAYSFPAYAVPILAACLKEGGSSVSCVNDFFSEDPSDIKKAIKNTSVAAFLSTTFLTNGRTIKRVTTFIKRSNPEIKVIAGGPGIINSPSSRKNADLCALYEGEETVRELGACLMNGEPVAGIRGISYFLKGKEVYTGKRDCVGELNRVPIPAWEALSRKVLEEKYLPIEASRGCVGKCSFCLETRYWPGIRLYPVERVVREMKSSYKRFGVKSFYFQDSNISNSRRHLLELCEGIKAVAPGIVWSCESRIDTLSDEVLQKMREAGCRAITFGMESADQLILKNMNKGITGLKLKAFSRLVKRMRHIGMLANINVIVGFPGETRVSMKRTTDFILESGPMTYSMSKFFLERGTDIWIRRREFGLSGSMFKWKHRTMASNEVDGLIKEVFLSIAKDPDVCHWTSASVDLVRHMAKGKSFKEFSRYIKAINGMCVEDLTKDGGGYSKRYDGYFNFISKYLA